MNKTIGTFLLACLLILPAAMVIGFSYAGVGHPIENKVMENDAFLNRSLNDIEIIFFGYAGCATICPASLTKLASVLESENIKNNGVSTGATFIEVKSIQRESDGKVAEHYSAGFSTQIRGYTPNLHTFKKLSEEFILKLYKNRVQNEGLLHTDHFFLLIRQEDQWIVKRVLDQQISERRMIEILESTAKNL